MIKASHLRVKSKSRYPTGVNLYGNNLHQFLKGGPDPSKSQAELRSIREKVPELTNVLFNGIFPADNVITAVQKNHGVHKIHMSEPAAGVLNATHWFSPITAAHDDCHMVPQLGRCECEQVPVLDADIASSLW